MKQPQLGQKILALRKEKKLTQEELVERCNISVRTIQRIESGEVTPRNYTVKSILNVLDYDFQQLEEEVSTAEQEFKNPSFFVFKDKDKAYFINKQLNTAWISGLIYFLICLVEAVLYFSKSYETGLLVDKGYIVIVEVMSLITLAFFMRGFVLIGKTLHNPLLKITAVILICITAIYYVFDLLSLITSPILEIFNISFGVISAFLGIALLKTQNVIGSLAAVTGAFQIITAVFFLTIALSWIGLLFLLPAILLEIIILYKVTENLKIRKIEPQIA